MLPILTVLKSLSPTTWLSIGLGGVIIAMGIAMAFMNVNLKFKEATIKAQEEEKRTLALTVDRLTSERDNCINAVDKQNAAVLDLEVKGNALQARLNKVATENKDKQRQIDELVKGIINKPVPKDCQGAMKELTVFVKKFADDWNAK